MDIIYANILITYNSWIQKVSFTQNKFITILIKILILIAFATFFYVQNFR